MKKEVLVLVFSNLKTDARVTRQVTFLSKHYHVTIVCFDADPMVDVDVVRISQTKLTLIRKAALSAALLLRQFKVAYRLYHGYEADLRKQLSDKKFDLVVANDVDTLPLAFALKGNGKVIFDAHEYAPRHFENIFRWRLFFQRFNTSLCERYIPKTDGMITLGQNIADEYEKNFGPKPTVITNAPNYYEVSPTSVDPKNIRLVHQGIANHSRQIELMIDMMKHLPENYSLDLILLVPGGASIKTQNYIGELKKLASFTDRIKFLSPIPYNKLVAGLNAYDIGIILIPPINFNYENGLPNKFFELVQARVALAIGPSSEMVRYLKKYNLGVVSDSFDPQNLAEKILQLSNEDINSFKANANMAARELSAESNEVKLIELVNRVLSSQ